MLKLNQITKSFGGGKEPAIKALDLELQVGDFCTLIGSNGSGKSTLLRLISGEHHLTQGTISLRGENVTLKDRSAAIAMVTQDVNKGTVPEMSLLENMVLSHLRGKKAKLALYGHYKKEAIAQVQDLGVGLEAYIDQPLSNLSGGQRQMVATLMAIHSKPAILLLDEHTSALDPPMQLALMNYTAKAIEREKMTALLITHKMEDAIRYGNRLIMLQKGKIVLDVEGAAKAALTVDALKALFYDTPEDSHVH